MTSKYHESDKRADFKWLSQYFDVLHWPFYAAPLKVKCAYWRELSSVTTWQALTLTEPLGMASHLDF